MKAVSALTCDGPFRKDIRLREQIDDASDSLLANIGEGFGQATDRHFAKYLYIARGSLEEVRSHLAVGRARGYLDEDSYHRLNGEGAELVKMISGLIRHLLRSDRKNRY